MHVAVVCRGLGQPGSVAAVALRQARELSRRFEVTLVSDSFPAATDWRTAAASFRDLGFLRRFRHVPDEILFTRAARRALLDLHRDRPVGFVLCHSHAAAWLAARPFARATAGSFGFVVHGDISDRPKGTYDARLTAFYRWATPRAYRAADVVLALSSPFAEIARRAGAKRVEVVPNGIDPADIGLVAVPSSEPIQREPGEPLRILYAGRLSVEKGVTHLLRALALVRHEVALSIVGSGPLEGEIRAEIAARSLEDRVRLLGTRPRSELGAIYRAHHVFCTPTLSEPFASVITEALVSGLPVIASAVGGVPEVVEPGRNGLLVQPANATQLAEAIETIARDEPLRRRLAANAETSVLPRLSWQTVGERIAAVIEDVCLTRGRM